MEKVRTTESEERQRKESEEDWMHQIAALTIQLAWREVLQVTCNIHHLILYINTHLTSKLPDIHPASFTFILYILTHLMDILLWTVWFIAQHKLIQYHGIFPYLFCRRKLLLSLTPKSKRMMQLWDPEAVAAKQRAVLKAVNSKSVFLVQN